MDYEEYKDNLLKVKKSLINLEKLQEERFHSYCQFIEGLPANEQNLTVHLDIQYANLKRQYDAQISFIELLLDKVAYNKIVEEVMHKLQETRSSVNYNPNTASNFSNRSNDSFTKYTSLRNVQEEANKVAQTMSLGNEQHSKVIQNKTLENSPYAQYYEEFLKEYQAAPVKYFLDVNKKYISELSNYTLSTWDGFAYKDIISLSETGGNPKYYAYKLPKWNGKYYFAVPAKAVRFSDMQIIQAAILTFFELPLEEIAKSCGVMPKLIKPAVLEKRDDGLYYLKEKGKYEY